MPYIDTVGQCTFERVSGEDISDPEHYTCTCPGCQKVVSGKVKNRSLRTICNNHIWWELPDNKNRIIILYCSKECAFKHAPELVQKFRDFMKTMEDYYRNLQEAWK